MRRLPFRLLHQFRSAFNRLLAAEGMRSTDASLGLIATGSLDTIVLHRILGAAPPGDYELVCHPGYNDTDLDAIQTRLRAAREVERKALLQVIPCLAPESFERISFAGLPIASSGSLAQSAQGL